MKCNRILILVITLFLILMQSVKAQNKKFGLGAIVGEPTGISAKVWLSRENALAFGMGWSVEGYRFDGVDNDYNRVTRFHIHVDYLWHSFYAISSSGQFPLFYGIGSRINTGPRYGGTFAMRGVIGISWLPKNTPLEIFVELVPTLQLVTSTGLGMDAGLGARVFF